MSFETQLNCMYVTHLVILHYIYLEIEIRFGALDERRVMIALIEEDDETRQEKTNKQR